ncbi:MAG: hypothetical protein OXG51_01175 [Gammaproteobacteria bacterium]|nr:hypothetical protein [Gammaproteobacteria bacterium]
MNPIARFHEDRKRARAERDPCAELCALATVNADGAPEIRTLVLRDLEDPANPTEGTRLAVFINDSSPKWSAMARVSALAYFPVLKVQYRLSCATAPVPEALVHGRWQDRPETPKRMDWYYARRPQSSPVASRSQLIQEVGNLDLPEPLVAPPSARGLYLLPFAIERLDLNQPDGIHDRRRWQRPTPSSPRVGEPPIAKAQSAASVLDSGWTEATLVP